MIYTAPSGEITWKAVEEFCAQGIPEGAYLDYKVDFPTDLARTIAAMGNTIGGVILVGVQEGKNGKPVVPITGIPMERGLSERVTNTVLSNITPPVFPEVAVCPSESNERAIVVIRVPQSPESPHAIQSNTRVYLRTGNTSTPEALATLEQVEWLQARRAKAVKLRDHLFEEGIKRSNVLFDFVDRSQGVTVLRVALQPTNLILRIVPEFPREQFRTPPELEALFRKIRVRDYYGTDHEFPIGNANGVLLQNGAYTYANVQNNRGSRHYYTELSVFGQLFFRQTLDTTYQTQTLVRASEIFCRVDEFCESARKFYSELGYQGYVRFLVSIHGAHSLPLGWWSSDGSGMPLTSCPDESIGYESSFLVADWEKEANRVAITALKTVGWAYGWNLTEQTINQYYNQERRR